MGANNYGTSSNGSKITLVGERCTSYAWGSGFQTFGTASYSPFGWSGNSGRTVWKITVAPAANTKITSFSFNVYIKGVASGQSAYAFLLTSCPDSASENVSSSTSGYIAKSNTVSFDSVYAQKTLTFSNLSISSSTTYYVWFCSGSNYTSYIIHKDSNYGTYPGITITDNYTYVTSVSASSVTAGNNCSVSFTPLSTKLGYKLTFSVKGGSYTTGNIAVTSTSKVTYTGYKLALDTWIGYCPNSKSSTVSVTLTTYSDTSCKTKTGSCSTSFTLTFPWVSSMKDIANITTGSTDANKAKFKFTPLSTKYTYRFKCIIGSGSYNPAEFSVSNTNEYTFTTGCWTASAWGKYFTSSKSTTVTVTLITYNGTASVGTCSKTFTLTIENYSSNISLSATYTNSYTTSSRDMGNKYLSKLSKLTASATASSLYGATISSYKMKIDSGSETTGATQTLGTWTVSSITNKTLYITATDSRGYTKTISYSFTVIPYSVPTVSAVTAERSDSDKTVINIGCAKITLTDLSSSCGLSHYVRTSIRESSKSTWSTVNNDTSSTGTITNYSKSTSGKLTTRAYVIRVAAYDGVQYVYKEVTVMPSDVLIDFNNSGKALSIGRMSTATNGEKLFEVSYPTVLYDTLTIKGKKITFDAGDTLNMSTSSIGYGYVSSSTKLLNIALPINRIITASNVTLTSCKVSVRQNGVYLFENKSDMLDLSTYCDYECSIRESGIFISATRKDNKVIENATNNYPVVAHVTGIFTFS